MADKKRRNIIHVSTTSGFVTLLKCLTALLLFLLILCLMKTCVDCNKRTRYIVISKTGYLPQDEVWDSIPDIIPPFDNDDYDNLPEKVSLEEYFPPIGDQGSKGTCVAWAVGYNLKTALNAIDNGWTQAQLSDSAYQTSPGDLWLGIPIQNKGDGQNVCNGTQFNPAFMTLVRYGAASMKDTPYDELGNCIGIQKGDVNNRIASFSQVVSDSIRNVPSVEQIKSYISNKQPLVIGASLGERFFGWSTDDVITYDTKNYRGMHANHAMVLTGFDDSRNAFRVRNSWGEQWGDDGSIWVDYNFFINEFCFAVFVAENAKK